MSVNCKFVEKAGKRLSLRIYWGENESAHGKAYGYHQSIVFVKDFPFIGPPPEILTGSRNPKTPEEYELYSDDGGHVEIKDLWKKTCDECDSVAPEPDFSKARPYDNESVHYQYFFNWLYAEKNSAPRLLEPGDMFWADYFPKNLHPRGHLMVCLPVYESSNGDIWDIMSVATNCSHPNKENDSHQCWQITGDLNELPNISVWPSIDWHGKYHGWLRNGQLVRA